MIEILLAIMTLSLLWIVAVLWGLTVRSLRQDETLESIQKAIDGLYGDMQVEGWNEWDKIDRAVKQGATERKPQLGG